MESPASSVWFDLFEEHAGLAESSLQSYESLNRLDNIPSLSFLKGLVWNEIKTWVKNTADPMGVITHEDLDGPGKVYVGGMNHALNDDVLQDYQISAVISIHPPDTLAWDPNDASYGLRRFTGFNESCPVKYHLMIPLEDSANANLMDYLDETYEFMRTHLRDGHNILVHCKSGRSRSVAVVIAYLQRKHYQTTICPRSLDVCVALSDMYEYREAVTESVRQQRLPVIIIMERFESLLRVYDLQQLGHPDYEQEKIRLFQEPPKKANKVPLAVEKPEKRDEPQLEFGGMKKIKAKGGAAVLKICIAILFFKSNQKPPMYVLERLFEINEVYYYELEGLEYGDRSYRGSLHAHPGFCKFYAHYAEEFRIEAPRAVIRLSSR